MKDNWNILIIIAIIIAIAYFKEKLFEFGKLIFVELPQKIYPSSPIIGFGIILGGIIFIFYWLVTKK